MVRGVFRMRAEGVEHMPEQGAVVLASTHRSNFDTFVLGIPTPWRWLRPMAKVELYRNPVLGWVLEHGGAFPVRRGENDRQAIVAALRILKDGGVLAMYPEGTRNRDGRAPVHPGAARLALQAGAALVPAAVVGTDEVRLWPPRLPQFRVAFGPPIPLDDLRGRRDMRAAADEATERWKVAVQELEAKLR